MKTMPEWVADWWKPMDTAPRDGTDILVYLGPSPMGDVAVVFYDKPSDDAPSHCWHKMDGIAYHQDLPTAWMPRPPSPRHS